MTSEVTRRKFLRTAGVGVAAGTALSGSGAAAAADKGRIKIVGVCCSLRKGKTTAAALQVCLEAAQAVAPDQIGVEMIELAGLKIPTSLLVGVPLEPGEQDDFVGIAPKLSDPKVAGIIVGTPVYFANMTSLCKAFLERCGVFRKKNFALSGKVGGVLAVGGVRSGGQELTIQTVQAALMCQEMVVVGDGRPTGHFGARLWNMGDDDISQDEFGLSTAKNLGRHVAEVALPLNPVAQ